MSVIEIVLIVIGAVIFLLGYLLPAGKKDAGGEVQMVSEAEIRKLIEGEAETVRQKVSDIVDETIGYSIEKTERAMERVANEKIMAVNEYSDTVLEEINKNHREVTFLYDMLNDKHETMVTGVGEANQLMDEIRQTVRDAEIMAQETIRKVKDAESLADGTLTRIRNAELTARGTQEAVQEAVESVMEAVEDTRMDIRTLHSARGYIPDVVQEVWEVQDIPEEDGPYLEPEPEAIVQEAVEEVDFHPIRPRRVEIIHEPEADYVAPEPDISTSAAFAEMGIFGRQEFLPEEPRGVDIHFAQGNDNGRNSNERILELHKAGKSNMAIAKELGLGLGEVKLVIDLFEGM